MFALQGGLVRQFGPSKDLPYVRRNPNWKGGGVPRGGTEHAGHAYWTSTMNPDGVPQKMPKVGEKTTPYSKVVSIHDVYNPSRKRAPAGAFSRSPNVSAMGIVPPSIRNLGSGPSQSPGFGSSNGRPEITTPDEDFFDATDDSDDTKTSPFFSSDNPFQSGNGEFSGSLEFSVGEQSVDDSTSSIFPGSFPSSTTGKNGGGETNLGNDGLLSGSDKFTPPEMSLIPGAPRLEFPSIPEYSIQASEAQDSLITLMNTPSIKEIVLKRKLKKARLELERVQGVYESLSQLPTTNNLDVRDEGMQVINKLKKEATGVINGLNKTIEDLKKRKAVNESTTQTTEGDEDEDTVMEIVPMLERVVENMEIVVEEISRKRKRGDDVAGGSSKRRNVTNENAVQLTENDLNPNINFGPMTLPVRPSFIPTKRRRSSTGKSGPPSKKQSLLEQALSLTASSSRRTSSASSGSSYSPRSSIVSGSSEGSGGFDRRALDLK